MVRPHSTSANGHIMRTKHFLFTLILPLAACGGDASGPGLAALRPLAQSFAFCLSSHTLTASSTPA